MSNLTPVPLNGEIWRAYAIAPAVTPIALLAIVFAAGGTLPANVVGIGFLACYFVAGLIGMPIAYRLRRRNLLNARAIHGAVFLCGILWSLFCTVVAIYTTVAIGGSVQSLTLTTAWFVAFFVPPVLLAGTAFRLLLKDPKLI